MNFTRKIKKAYGSLKTNKPLILLVPGAGIEPAQPQGPRDFKTKTDEKWVAS
jgi:hypothetical protein